MEQKFSYGDIQEYTDILLSKCFENAILGCLEILLCQSFFFDTNQKHVCGKIYKVIKVFGCVAEVSFLQWLADSRFVKWVRFFERSCVVKLVIFFARFCWLRAFLLENLKLRQILQIWDFESFIFWSKFRLFGILLGRFSQCNSKVFCRRPTMVADILTQLPSP